MERNLRVWPVGAVSNTTTENCSSFTRLRERVERGKEGGGEGGREGEREGGRERGREGASGENLLFCNYVIKYNHLTKLHIHVQQN